MRNYACERDLGFRNYTCGAILERMFASKERVNPKFCERPDGWGAILFFCSAKGGSVGAISCIFSIVGIDISNYRFVYND